MPAEFRGGRSFQNLYGQPESKTEIEFRINPARPGRYWLKAARDRKPPFRYDLGSLDGFQAWLASTNNALAFGPGDAESGAPAVFEIKAQQSVSTVVECRTIDYSQDCPSAALGIARNNGPSGILIIIVLTLRGE